MYWLYIRKLQLHSRYQRVLSELSQKESVQPPWFNRPCTPSSLQDQLYISIVYIAN